MPLPCCPALNQEQRAYRMCMPADAPLKLRPSVCRQDAVVPAAGAVQAVLPAGCIPRRSEGAGHRKPCCAAMQPLGFAAARLVAGTAQLHVRNYARCNASLAASVCLAPAVASLTCLCALPSDYAMQGPQLLVVVPTRELGVQVRALATWHAATCTSCFLHALFRASCMCACLAAMHACGSIQPTMVLRNVSLPFLQCCSV